jgi:hypothetical protein
MVAKRESMGDMDSLHRRRLLDLSMDVALSALSRFCHRDLVLSHRIINAKHGLTMI